MFDPKKYAFYLVAAVISVYLIIALGGVIFCGFGAWYGKQLDGCQDTRLGEFLASILAVALALYGARK